MLNPKATLAVIICHMLTGSASVATRYLVGTMQPLDIAFLRYLLGGLALLPLLLVARRQPLSGRLVIQILSLGILFFGLFPWIHATAFQYTTASRGAIVLATMPIWAMLLGHFLGSDPFSLRTLSGIFLAVAGVGIALYDKSLSADIGAGFQGELIMLVAAIVGAIYSVFSKPVLKHTTAYLFTPLAMLSGCLFLSPMAVQENVFSNYAALPATPLVIMAYLGIIAGGLAFFLFNWVLDKTTPTITTLFVTLNPVTAIVLAWLLLDEAMTPYFFLGATMVIIGIVLSLWPQRKEQNLSRQNGQMIAEKPE